MKNLQIKYKKKELQVVKCEITLYNHKHEIYIYANLIGFCNEYYEPGFKYYINNFYRYNHIVYSSANKLYDKYPYNVLKSQYKEWLKKYNEKSKHL